MPTRRRSLTLTVLLLALALFGSACTGRASTTVSPAIPTPTASGATTTPQPTALPDPDPTTIPTAIPDESPVLLSLNQSTPPPTPTPPTEDPFDTGCRADSRNETVFDIVNVEPNDPDGGLVIHTTAGVDTPVVGVIPWYARGIQFFGQCEILPSGAEWWQVSSHEGFGWVNAAYLGQRESEVDQLAVTPCRTLDGTDLDPESAGGSAANYGSTFVVNDIRVESTPACDRVVIELASDWDFGTTPRPLDAFPVDAVVAINHWDQEMQLELNGVFATAFDSIPPIEAWRDVATDEQNVALVVDRDDHSEIHIGWGLGIAAVAFEPSPARIIVDIVQVPSPPETLHGPIVATDGYGPMLFAPINEQPFEAVRGPITVRGWSRGFEASSFFDIRPWNGTNADHPGNWDGVLFGSPNNFDSAPRPDLSFDPPLPSFGDGAAVFPFMTGGYFEYEIGGFEAGPWQLAIVSSGGISCPPAAGQQFWVADDPAMLDGLISAGLELVTGEPFGLRQRFVEGGETSSETTIDVRGVSYSTATLCE